MIKISRQWRARCGAIALSAAGLAGLAGVSGSLVSPAFADEWHDRGHGHGHWDHGRHRGHYRDDVVVERRRQVIVRERPVYVTPSYAPPAYYAPPPGYYQPSFDMFLRLD